MHGKPDKPAGLTGRGGVCGDTMRSFPLEHHSNLRQALRVPCPRRDSWSALMSAQEPQNARNQFISKEAQQTDPKGRERHPRQQQRACERGSPDRVRTPMAVCPTTGHVFRFSTQLDAPCAVVATSRTNRAISVLNCTQLSGLGRATHGRSSGVLHDCVMNRVGRTEKPRQVVA